MLPLCSLSTIDRNFVYCVKSVFVCVSFRMVVDLKHVGWKYVFVYLVGTCDTNLLIFN